MTKFYGDPNEEAGGAFGNGETWHVTFDSNGILEAVDSQIEKALIDAAAHPDSPVALSAADYKAKAKAREQAAAEAAGETVAEATEAEE